MVVDIRIYGKVAVGIMLPASHSRLTCGKMISLHIYRGVVGSAAGGKRADTLPSYFKSVAEEQMCS